MQRNITVNKKYKDRLFRLVFNEKKHILDLYNAMTGRQYTDPEALTITTLEDVIYIGMKNDVSFLLDNVLNLWEHQSSYNPNMPLRGLFYFARLYREYIEKNSINIYSDTRKSLPLPQYVVFYNGTRDEPERTTLKLSDSFFQLPDGDIALTPAIEVTAVMLNINLGKNRELMEKCKRLWEYAEFELQFSPARK